MYNTEDITLDACVTVPSTQPKYPIKTLAYRPHTEDYGRIVSLYVKDPVSYFCTKIIINNELMYITEYRTE